MSTQTLKMALAGLSMAVLLSPSNLLAQNDSASINLDTVVVTASRGEESIREVTSNITVIDEQAIQRAPGSTLDSILRREGIHIMEYPGQGTSSIELRGIRNNVPVEAGGLGARNLLLIDGRPAGTGNVSALMKTNIARIEIIRGSAALAYGSQAMGGVVNVITKRGEGELSGHFQAGFGSWSYQDQEGGINGRTGDLDYSLGLFHSRSGSYKTADGYQSIGTDHKGIYSGSTSFGYNFLEDRHRIGLTSRFFYNELQGIGNSIDYPDSNSNVKLENESYDLTYTGKSESESLAWQLRYYHVNDKYFNYSGTTAREQIIASMANNIKTNGLQGQLTADFGLVELTGGVDWQKYDITRYSEYTIPRTLTPEITNLGAYLLGKVHLLDDSLIFSGGIRHDKFENNASGNSTTIDNWSPSLGVAYHPADWLKLRANVSRGFRAPTADELAMNYAGTWGLPWIGNANLDPEYSTNYEAGFDINYHSFWNFGLTYFQTDYKNRIEGGYPVTIGGTPYQTYQNSRYNSTTAGFEMNASFDIGEYADWSFRLAPYIKATYYTKRKGYYEPIDLNALIRIPKMTLAYGVDLDHPEYGLFINVNAMYFGRSTDVKYDNTLFRNVRHDAPSYTLVDLTVEKVVAEFADKHKISTKFAATNIFDKEYTSYPGYPSPGASVYMGVKYDFN